MNSLENRENLEQALWNIERYINFHAEEEYRDGFPRLRAALAEARRATQALLPPVIPLQEAVNRPEEVVETLSIRVNSAGERSVSAMNITVPRTPAPDVAGRPPRLSAHGHEFSPEALPSWTRVERALRAHRSAIVNIGSVPPPSYGEIYPDGPPESCRTSLQVPEFPPPSYEVAIKRKDNNLSSAAVHRSIIWPTEPLDPSTADFMANAIPAGYEDYNSDNEYLEHKLSLWQTRFLKIKMKIIKVNK